MKRMWLLSGIAVLGLFTACAPGAGSGGTADFPVKQGDTWQVDVAVNGSTLSYAVQSNGGVQEIRDSNGLFVMPLTSRPGFGGNAFYEPKTRLFAVGVYINSSGTNYFVCYLPKNSDLTRAVDGAAQFQIDGRSTSGFSCRIAKRATNTY
jgi:hypothetical protein